MRDQIDIIHEDNHILGIIKPAGLLVQGDATGDVTALALAKRYVKETYDKPGNVFLGLVHRIDRPVSGVVVFARTSKAASRLANAFRLGQVKKTYFAVVEGLCERSEGTLEGFIVRDHKRSRLVGEEKVDAKRSILRFTTLDASGGLTLLEVRPETGRHHQIRVQLAGEGLSIAGDVKYGSSEPLRDKSIALHAARLAFKHPVREAHIVLQAPPPDTPPWDRFVAATRARLALPD